MYIVLAATLAFIIAMLIPDTALAWGPATHLELAREITLNPAFLPAAARVLIEKYPHDFYYGNISADVVVGKNFVEELKHCHNWKFGFKLLKKAKSDSQRAFSYGYLSHLAADTIAHNNFIPEMMVRSFSSRIHRHIYWELRFDALADKRVWRLPEKIAREVHRDNDNLLRSTLEGTPFSFRTNKTIFSSIMNIHKIDHWHNMLNILSKTSKWALHRKDKDRFFTHSLECVKDILSNEKHAACTRHDPTGKVNLALANSARKRLKTERRRKSPYWQIEVEKHVEKFLFE